MRAGVRTFTQMVARRPPVTRNAPDGSTGGQGTLSIGTLGLPLSPVASRPDRPITVNARDSSLPCHRVR